MYFINAVLQLSGNILPFILTLYTLFLLITLRESWTNLGLQEMRIQSGWCIQQVPRKLLAVTK